MADATGGYLNWSLVTAENILVQNVVVGGVQLQVAVQPSGEFAAGGFQVPGAGGRTVIQHATEHPNAPLGVGPSGVSFDVGAMNDITEERLLRALAAHCAIEPVFIWLNKEVTDSWEITAGRTQWTISHRFAFATALSAASFTLPEPVVQVLNKQSSVVSSALTVVSGTPAAGEVQIDQTIDGFILTTFAGDLDADAGKRLVVHYQPLLACTLDTQSWIRPTANILDNELPVVVAAPARDWGADTA